MVCAVRFRVAIWFRICPREMVLVDMVTLIGSVSVESIAYAVVSAIEMM